MNKTAAISIVAALLAAPWTQAAWGHSDHDGGGHDDCDDNDNDNDNGDDQDSDHDSAPVVPAAIAVPAGYEVQAHFSASGVQIYTCAPSSTAPGTYLWTFVAPSATLYDEDGDVAGYHYAGPTWEASDGSKILGSVLAKSAAPDGTSVAWLLLSATVTVSGETFEDVGYVQRLNTSGGSAPATGCSSANAGAELDVPYTADYWFYARD